MKQPLPENLKVQLYEHGKLGRQAWQRGAVEEAESHFIAAWNVLPEPKMDQDFAQSLSSGLVIFYRDTRQFEKAHKWLEVMRVTYGLGPNEYVEFLKGTVCFDSEALDEAFTIFDTLYKKFKARPFQGYDKKYLDFYKKRKTSTK